MTLLNHMIFLPANGRLGLAWALLGLGLTGCLLPQDDLVFPSIPPNKNAPPIIVSQNPPSQVVTVCPTTEFSVSVFDDQGDTLQVLWYIDRTSESDNPVGAATTIRAGAPKTAKGALDNRLNGLIETGRHLVEVFVTDGLFSPTITPLSYPRGGTTDGGSAAPELDVAYVDQRSWFVEVKRCP